jgi:hypothetical protein
MPRALSATLRQQVVDLYQQQVAISAISLQLSISLNSVARLIAQHKAQPSHPPTPAYDRCGPHGPRSPAHLLRAALWLKRHHPAWGLPLIRVVLAKRYPTQVLPAIRTLQRHVKRAGLTPPKALLTQPAIGRATAPHNIWQVDAKERLVLLDGQAACYLSLSDEHSGAGLEALVFPPQPYQSGTHRRATAAITPCFCPLGATRSHAGR